jgi:hypothetical protein
MWRGSGANDSEFTVYILGGVVRKKQLAASEGDMMTMMSNARVSRIGFV